MSIAETSEKRASASPIPDKVYFKIGEVAEIVGVKPYVLRYWETEFPDIAPAKSKSKQRLYKRKEVEMILRIRDLLYKEKFTIEGARKRLEELDAEGTTTQHSSRALELSFLRSLRGELEAVLELLDPSVR